MKGDTELSKMSEAEPMIETSATSGIPCNPQTIRFNEILAAATAEANEESEVSPIESLAVPKGTYFICSFLRMLLLGIIVGYLSSIGFGLVYALINMMSGSCGQEVWKVPADEACNMLVLKSLTFDQDLRCLEAKPLNMTQDDFDQTCGDHLSLYLGIGIIFLVIAYIVYVQLAGIIVKVNFFKDFFTMESWDGTRYECCYYADVTNAEVGFTGLKITANVKASLKADGAADQGWVFSASPVSELNFDGEATLSVAAGNPGSEEREQFLDAFSRRLPVSIDGSDSNQRAPQTSASMFDGRLQEILDDRRASANDCRIVRKPITCDLWTEVVLVLFGGLLLWYLYTFVSNVIDWAIRKGEQKCMNPMKPGVDFCDFARTFIPIDIPFVRFMDYLNLAVLICGAAGAMVWYVRGLIVEYKFFKNGGMQDVQFSRSDGDTNMMIFADDVENVENVCTTMEKGFKVEVCAQYMVSGKAKSFNIKVLFYAKDAPKEVTLAMVDADCASCTGQGQVANQNQHALFNAVRKFKPGCIVEDMELGEAYTDIHGEALQPGAQVKFSDGSRGTVTRIQPDCVWTMSEDCEDEAIFWSGDIKSLDLEIVQDAEDEEVEDDDENSGCSIS